MWEEQKAVEIFRCFYLCRGSQKSAVKRPGVSTGHVWFGLKTISQKLFAPLTIN